MKIKWGPDPGLVIGAGIARGVAGFANSFQQARQAEEDRELRRRQAEYMNELNRMKMAKLAQETQPQQVDLLKLGAAWELVDGGVPGAEKLLDYGLKQAWDSIETPAQAVVMGRAVKSLVQRRAPVQLGAPPAPQADTPSEPAAEPAQPPRGTVMMNPAERDLFKSGMTARTQANIAMGRNQTALQTKSIEGMNAQDLARLRGEYQLKMKEIDARIAADRNQTEVSKAKIGAKARVDSVKARPASGGSAGGAQPKLDPVTVKTAETLLRVIQPSSGINFNPPARIDEAKKSLSKLVKQNPILRSQLPEIDGVLGVSTPAAPAPAPTGGGAAKSEISADEYRALRSRGERPAAGTIVNINGTKYRVNQDGKAEPVQE